MRENIVPVIGDAGCVCDTCHIIGMKMVRFCQENGIKMPRYLEPHIEREANNPVVVSGILKHFEDRFQIGSSVLVPN